MGLFGGTSNAGTQARQQQQLQQGEVQQATNRINQAFSGFTPQYYQNRAQAYTNFAEPQLMQQYQDTSLGLLDKLGNQGLLNSSAGLQERGALQNQLGLQQQGVANTGIQQAQQLQQQVAGEQSSLIGQANAAADPLSVSQQALGQAANFAAPSAFQPLGNLFQNFANTYLGSQLASTYNPNLYGFYLGGGAPQQGFGQTGAGFGAPQQLY